MKIGENSGMEGISGGRFRRGMHRGGTLPGGEADPGGEAESGVQGEPSSSGMLRLGSAGGGAVAGFSGITKTGAWRSAVLC